MTTRLLRTIRKMMTQILSRKSLNSKSLYSVSQSCQILNEFLQLDIHSTILIYSMGLELSQLAGLFLGILYTQ